MYTCIL